MGCLIAVGDFSPVVGLACPQNFGVCNACRLFPTMLYVWLLKVIIGLVGDTPLEETVESDSELREYLGGVVVPWLREVGVAERRPVRTSRDVRSGRSSRPRLHRVLYFPHRRLWIMECSCKVWCRPCRRRTTPRLHSRLSWRLRFAELSKYAPHSVTDEHRKAKKFVMGLKPSLRMRLVAFEHRTLDEALSAACRQEGEMEQYLEGKKASQKRPAATFQRQDKKKQCTRHRSVHDHKIKDCPRLQQGVQRGAPAPTAVAAAAPAIGRPGRPRAPARVFALAREDAEQAEHVTEAQLSLRSSVLDEVIEQQKDDPRLLELVGKAGIARYEDGLVGDTPLEETVESDSERGE
ncbi:hypothetical protein Taro_044930 [Colocasia esculenta]|uniref:Uncharacterized protein n=1 Tax=Colocasia esculenta TaxID=4460 RepID=A0A843WV90_COLES|nr:hypothetical protein [Colocasia esculenta]